MDSKIRFEFISSYAGAADYRIVRYGHPDHGKRVEIRYLIDALYTYGRAKNTVQRRFNYTPTKYAHYVARVKGYMYRQCNAITPLDPEYAIAYDEQCKEEYDQARIRYPDLDWTPYERSIKGTAHLVPTGKAEHDYTWQLVPAF